MDARSCGNCRHYEPSATWRKGWCRNTLLFAPRQSYLVRDNDLDCSRGTEDFWEPRRDHPGPRSEIAGKANVRFPRPSPLKLFAPVPPSVALANAGSNMMFASGYDDDDDDGYDPEPAERVRGEATRRPARASNVRRATADGGRQRTVNFQPEERYWTEYLRIALPIIGLLLMIGLFWFWATQLIGDNGGTDETPTQQPGNPALAVNPSTPSPTETPAADAGQAPAPTSAPAPSTPPADEPTEESASGGNPDTSAEEEQAAAAELAIGGSATVNDSGVRLRPETSTESDPLSELGEGTAVTINDGPVEAGDYRWWQVTVDETGLTGWVVEDYLDAVP